MSNRRNGPVKRAAIRLLAEERRLPLAAAAHRYAMMPIRAKVALCRRVEASGKKENSASRKPAAAARSNMASPTRWYDSGSA
ncbi:hypothetical protein [Methylobacterium aquaticum]|uniref:hypothetical protein n=1 Tax=Methylobacterium aquaticum TaxID=270351 RepID=UPI0011AE95FB|nr:hypothetical protein [Methylobacterium aquaticum]